MYCPICLNDTLKLSHRGIVKVTINKKSKSNSQFSYNLKKDSQEIINTNLKSVLVDYFQWYQTLDNKPVITHINLTSCDFICSKNCTLDLSYMMDVIGLIITEDSYKKVCNNAAKACGTSIDLTLKR